MLSTPVAMVGAGMIIFFVLVAILAPVLCAIFNVDPFTLNTDKLDDLGFPSGPFAGASREHPLGVEPGIGRDVFARGAPEPIIKASTSRGVHSAGEPHPRCVADAARA